MKCSFKDIADCSSIFFDWRSPGDDK